MVKSTFREIKTSLARYLAIFSIVALGVGFFAGLKDCKSSMVAEAREYLGEHNMYDYQILSSYGIDDESVELALAADGVTDAEASIQMDVLAAGEADSDNEAVLKCISLPDTINTIGLVEGRMPEADDECLVDDYTLKGGMYRIGGTIKLSKNNDKDTRKSFKVGEFKIVGRINTPLYLDYQRGSSSLGNGSLDTFFYVRKDVFDIDYYTNLYVTLEGDAAEFSTDREDLLEAYRDEMDRLAEDITDARREAARSEAQDKLDEKKQEYNDSLDQYRKEKAETEKKLGKAGRKLKNGKETISASRTEINNTIAGLNAQLDQLEQAHTAGLIDDNTYYYGKAQLENGIAQAEAGLAEIDRQSKELAKGEKSLRAGRKKANREFGKAKRRLDDAEEELSKAQKKIDEMETGNSYALAKTENAGYSSFDSNSSIVSNIAKIFPVFFILIAALVCMTTMTRMVDEQRTQIGILKALGYSNAAVVGKYMFYSGSAALLGAVFGFFVGCKVFPTVIWHAYTMMYDFSDTVPFVFDGRLLAISLAVALACSMGATWISISQDFSVAPADLIRPKTPRAGKRILLERIKPIWNRLSFLYKVSMRNIFRYKKRFFMMVIGVSGCTALLIAGIGINTTISRVAEYQFGEVSLYDYQIVFDREMTADRQADFMKFADKKTDGDTGDVLFLHSASLDAYHGRNKLEVNCIATDSPDFEKYIDLHYGDEDVTIPGDGEIAICRKVQKELGVEIGDEVRLQDGYREMTARVATISDNYVGEVIYMSASAYENGFGAAPEIKTAYIKAPEAADEAVIREQSTALGKYDDAAAVVLNLDTLEVVDTMMNSLKGVVYVVILSAALLAFIVLYNLTNINITERIREIATIKVLGFHARETSQYVFRENVFLTAIAALAGIPLGKWLLRFVIDNIVVSMIYFQPRMNTADYLLAVALTFVFAFVVNMAMQGRLKHVSMTESLKSTE